MPTDETAAPSSLQIARPHRNRRSWQLRRRHRRTEAAPSRWSPPARSSMADERSSWRWSSARSRPFCTPGSCRRSADATSKPTTPMSAGRPPSSARRCRAMCRRSRSRTSRMCRPARSSSGSRTASTTPEVAQARANVLTQDANLENSDQAQTVEGGQHACAGCGNRQRRRRSFTRSRPILRRTDALIAHGWVTPP